MSIKRSRQAFESDRSTNESYFVTYGTPLPSSDLDTRDDGSYVPVWQQEVTDERGRKRLHGAFTGGFSAGYFNTVGSKEGWTPSTFVSSRTDRKKTIHQKRAEDFMDDEDVREAEESRHLSANNAFQGFGTEDDVVRKSTLVDLFAPREASIGVMLLQRMGWKQGQGLGTRIRRAARVGADPNSEDAAEKHLFAPDDQPMMSFVRKLDTKGVGYESEADGTLRGFHREKQSLHRIPEPQGDIDGGKDDGDDTRESLFGTGGQHRSPGSRKSAFGVGVLNDTGSDDEDPYSMGPKISLGRGLGREKKSKNGKTATVPAAKSSLSEKPVFLSRKLAGLKGGLRKCRDGRLPIDGFVLAEELDSFAAMSLQDDRFKPPEVPSGWKSSFNEADNAPADEATPGMKVHSLDMKSRASPLGESQLPSKSVFDFMSGVARDRLAKASGKVILPAALDDVPPQGSHAASRSSAKSLRDLVPHLDSEIASQALKRGLNGWMPYAEDEQKQQRYRKFLQISCDTDRMDLPPRASGSTLDDWSIEMQEFARAAQVFRPVSGLMANRFTSSKSTSLPQSSPEGGAETLISRPKPKPEDPAEAAARMGMFGPMTRSVTKFYPSRLLCKRFNVPMPDHEDEVGVQDRPQERGYRPNFPASDTAINSAASFVNQPSVPEHLMTMGTTAVVQEARIDPEHNEALEKHRPGGDVFKAIFGSDDEDD